MQNDLFDLPKLRADFSAASKDEARRPAAHLPVSLRMTFEERARLERDASGMSLSDNAASFAMALEDRGLFLARGDRGGHVVVTRSLLTGRRASSAITLTISAGFAVA